MAKKVSTRKSASTSKRGAAAAAALKKSRRAAKEELGSGDANALNQYTSKVCQEVVRKIRVKTGDPYVCTLGKAEGLVVGLPVPSLSFEILLQSNVLPLGRAIQLVGVEKVCKSGFCFEVVRWFREANGFGCLLEHESKFSAEWARSIIGWDDPNAMAHIPCDSIDDWQSKMQLVLTDVKREMRGTNSDPGLGKTWPLAVIVDSVMGKPTVETIARIEKTGHAGKGWPDEARSITMFVRKITTDLARWPFLLLMVNHLKPYIDPKTQAKIRNKPGGKGLNFHESYELEMNWGRGGRSKSMIRLVDRTGMRLRMTCANASFGEHGREIPVTVWMWQEEADKPVSEEYDWRQVTRWDWHGSTVEFLLRESSVDGGFTAKKIKEIVNLQKLSNARRVYAQALGIPKSEAQPFDVVGKMIYQNKDMRKALRRLFGVKVWKIFRPGVSFDKQIQEVKRKIVQRKPRTVKKVSKDAEKDTSPPVTE